MARAYTVNTIHIDRPQTVLANCNASAFKNIGTSIAVVGGVPLSPGEGWTPFEPNGDDVDQTGYIVRFDNSNGGDTNLLCFITKIYK